MLEQQRFEYLQAMGIQLWMPREPVDNAAGSLWFAGDEVVSKAGTDLSEQALVRGGHAVDLLADVSSAAPKIISEETNIVTANAVISNAVASKKAQANIAVSQDTSISAINRQTNTSRELASPSHLSSSHLSSSHLSTQQKNLDPNKLQSLPAADLTAPEFELFFAQWPCGILWVASQPFDQRDHSFQTSVSHFLLNSAVLEANYSHFKWPYILGSNEDQSTSVALRALTAQWDFVGQQGARAWVSADNTSLEWLSSCLLYTSDAADE